jgi:hypothetical protein
MILVMLQLGYASAIVAIQLLSRAIILRMDTLPHVAAYAQKESY